MLIASLKSLQDSELLSSAKIAVQKERSATTLVLRHLAEIERRKLYSDLHYGSLFEYAVYELKYSEASAGRRIQAMRLLNEIPEIESKIECGDLNLSNICQAQCFFRDQKKAQPEVAFSRDEKKEILEKLEHKSAREGERILFEMGGEQVLPRERERIVSAEHTELRFLVNQELKAKLEEVRSLLGARGAQMNFAELVAAMAGLSVERLKEKRFGKTRAAQTVQAKDEKSAASASNESANSDVGVGRRTRYIPPAVKHQAWTQAKGTCACCGSKQNLQYDHIKPFALGGASTAENIQLLCQSCNLRRGIQYFGTQAMHRENLANF